MSNVGDPASFAAVVTPSDSTFLDQTALALYIGVSGNVSIQTLLGTTVIFENVPVGILSVKCTRVNSTGTTASSIVALW